MKLDRRLLAILAVVGTTLLLGALPSAFGEGDLSEKASLGAQDSQFVAYYFHGNYRCSTCRKIETLSKEAITEGFASDIASGRLSWRVVNTDEASNRHFVQDFELVTKSVVLAEISDGAVKRWKRLDEVWKLVGNTAAFTEYVRKETRIFIEPS